MFQFLLRELSKVAKTQQMEGYEAQYMLQGTCAVASHLAEALGRSNRVFWISNSLLSQLELK